MKDDLQKKRKTTSNEIKWKTTSNKNEKMEDDLKQKLKKWKTTYKKWKTTSNKMEDNLNQKNGRRP